MNEEERCKIYSAFTEISRKWVTQMDTKAAFISAMSGGLLAFLWSGAKLYEAHGLSIGFGLVATILAIAALLGALGVVLPRNSLKEVFGLGSNYSNGQKPISFYGFVAQNYSDKDVDKFISDVSSMSKEDIYREALEQHFILSHAVARKSKWVSISGLFLISALGFASVALFFRGF